MPSVDRRGLYYPFHLCYEQTLDQLLNRYHSVHFRDYMALQLTPLTGTTAYHDRMGDQHPDLVKTGRIVQGYAVSGPLDADFASAIDRDLQDGVWRDLFHQAIAENRRFQRGLFDFSHAVRIGKELVPGAAALLQLLQTARQSESYSVERVRQLSHPAQAVEDAYSFEYGLALLKTSAALVHTVQLALRHTLEPVTDSTYHFRLFGRTCEREDHSLSNHLVPPVSAGHNSA